MYCQRGERKWLLLVKIILVNMINNYTSVNNSFNIAEKDKI